MIVELFMSDFYPGLHSDQRLIQRLNENIKMEPEEQRINKEKQFVRMVTVQKIIKQYKRYSEAVKIMREQKKIGVQDEKDL